MFLRGYPSFRHFECQTAAELIFAGRTLRALQNPNPAVFISNLQGTKNISWYPVDHHHIMSKEAYVPPTRDASSPAASSTPAGGLQSFAGAAPRAPAAISYLCAGNP